MFFKINKILSIQLNILSINFSAILKTAQNDILNLIINIVDLIFEFSSNDYGRLLILDNFDTNKYGFFSLFFC